MHRRLLVIVLPALLAGLALPAAAAASKRHVPKGFLGVNVGGPMLGSGVDVGGESAVMARAGAEVVRLPVDYQTLLGQVRQFRGAIANQAPLRDVQTRAKRSIGGCSSRLAGRSGAPAS